MAKGLTGNASNFRDIKFAERIEAERAARYEHALRRVMATPEGRIVFAQIIRGAGVFRNAFSSDALVMAHETGRQAIGLELRHQLQVTDSELFDVMDADERAWLREQRTLTASHNTRGAGQAVTQDTEEPQDNGE